MYLGLRFIGAKDRLSSFGRITEVFTPNGYFQFTNRGLKLDGSGKLDLGVISRQPNQLPVKTLTFSMAVLLQDTSLFDNAVILRARDQLDQGFDLGLTKAANQTLFLLYINFTNLNSYKWTVEIVAGQSHQFAFTFTKFNANCLITFYAEGKAQATPHDNLPFELNNLNFKIVSTGNFSAAPFVQEFIILDTPLSFLLSTDTNARIGQCNANCLTQLFPAKKPSCIRCKTGFLNDGICVPYCPLGQQAFAGACVKCAESECSGQLSLQLFRLNHTNFTVLVAPPLPGVLRKENLRKMFSVRLENKTNISPVFTPVNDHQFSFSIAMGDSFYFRKLTLKVIPTAFNQIASQDGVAFRSTQKEYLVSSYRNMREEDRLADVCSAIMAGLYYSLLTAAVFHLVLSFKYLNSEFATKKIFWNLQKMQLTAFLIFYNVVLPKNVYRFLKNVYSRFLHVSRLNRGVLTPKHSNFFEFEFDPNFRNNATPYFYVFIVVVGLTLFLYILSLLAPRLSFQMKERIQTFREKLQYLPLIGLFMYLNNLILFYATFQLRYGKDAVAGYLAGAAAGANLIIVVGFAAKTLHEKYFIQHSELKEKIALIFLGFAENRKAHVYELVRNLFLSLYCVSIVLLIDRPFAQALTGLCLYASWVLYFYFFSAFTSGKEMVIELYSDVFFALGLAYICILAYLDREPLANERARYVLG